MTLYTEILARLFNCRSPFRMATSPPVTAIIATTGERKMKGKVWSPQLKVHRLSSGLNTTHSTMPNKAVRKAHERIRDTEASSIAFSSRRPSPEICLTPLMAMPKFVESERSLIVELKRDTSPIPFGPRIIATSLLRMIPTNIFIPSTPPKRPVYLRM